MSAPSSEIQGTRIPTPRAGAKPFGNEKRYEELRLEDCRLTGRTGPSTLTLLRENTSANSVSMSARSKRSNQGISTIQRTPPTPVLGNGRNGILTLIPAMPSGYEKSDEALISSGPSTWSLSNQGISNIQGTRICPCAPTRRAGYVRNGIRTSIPAKPCGNVKSNEVLRLKECRLPRRTGFPNLVPGSCKSLVHASIMEAERKVTSEVMMDDPKDKSGNEVAADGATAAQSHEEVALRSLPLKKGLYRDLPGSTSAQADNYEESRLEYCQLPGDPDLAPALAMPFRGEPNKPAEPNRTKPERGEQKNRKPNKPVEPNRIKRERYKPKRKVPTRNIAYLEAKRKVKSGNEVAADGATAAQSQEGASRSLPLKRPSKDSPGSTGSTSVQVDNNEKVKKTLLERIGPYVLLTILLVGGIVVAYFCSRNASHVKMFNEKANDVYQNVWASSPCISFSPRIALVNIETGTSEGQGWRKAG